MKNKKTLREKFKTDKEILKYLNTISPSFCVAKWKNATIWFGSGLTTSCHHPLPHKIDNIEIKSNPSAIHNTTQKIKDRNQMLIGERPLGCDYCWKVEDNIPNGIPDRVYKSSIYTEKDIELLIKENTYRSNNINLKTLEVSFDRTCNLACSYCNPAFSSTWVKEIKKNGPYKNLISDGRNHFTHTHNNSQLFKKHEINPYIEAFWKWWESDLKFSLEELRITGGEPFMSDEVWKLLDKFAEEKPNMRLAINTNLIMKPMLFDKFMKKAIDIEHLHIYTSGESFNTHANYIRDGLNWHQWIVNCHLICKDLKPEGFHIMATINALCLETLPEFLHEMMFLKALYGKKYASFTLNILRFPSFQSPLILPKKILITYAEKLSKFLAIHNKLAIRNNINFLSNMEINHIERLIDYLLLVDNPHNEEFELSKLHNDFKQFYKQYDMRRGKNFKKTFPKLADWYDELC